MNIFYFSFEMNVVDFYKMHGLGNDFVIINNVPGAVSADVLALLIKQVKRICDRKMGVGCDQLIILQSLVMKSIRDNIGASGPLCEDTDFTNANICEMLIYNSDGSQASACGNASRCVGLLLCWLSADSAKRSIIKVGARLIQAEVISGGGVWSHSEVIVNMGQYTMSVVPEIFDGVVGYYIDVGNEHLVFFMQPEQSFNIDFAAEIGQKYRSGGVNVSLARVIDRNNIKISVWERGVGETSACGSAACAVHAVSHALGFVDTGSFIHFKDGKLKISIDERKNIIMQGDATLTFQGAVYL
ncbi:Diaminopimelate epimerase [Alphaproteobacteria bacterium]